MSSEAYLPGHSPDVTDFMARRSLATHGAFFLPHLEPGVSVLDCGCGPGSITLGIAARVASGEVVGIDREASQIERAETQAVRDGVDNVAFQTADCAALPFDASRFDRIFSHALLEHLADPVRALREWHRVLKPGGVIGLCCPDWGGFLLSPPSEALSQALDRYMSRQNERGGDVRVGRKLGVHLAAAGFERVELSARYECYASPAQIGEYLASQLERDGDVASAGVFREWSEREGALFAQAWVSAVAFKATE